MSLESAMQAIPTMLIIWAAVTACFVALLTYRGQLTRYEQERLFLTNINPSGQRQQIEIVKRINQIQPYVRIFGILSTLVTIGIIAIWTADAWNTLHT
jgi:ABC-type transport system involved in cytochrome c biogenesis permease subunit